MMNSVDFISIIHSAIQYLLPPTLVLLSLFLLFVFIEFVAFCVEGWRRPKLSTKLLDFLHERETIHHTVREFIETLSVPQRQKDLCFDLVSNRSDYGEMRIRQEELQLQKILERTDYAAKLGPFLGLMGTLLPLGPGLSALAEGNVSVLASAVSVAFDTTVLGLAVGGIGFLISRTRRRWYEEYILFLETIHSQSQKPSEANTAQTNKKVTSIP
jgi:biopolymer transport protein ExbB/TolQ